MAIKYFIWIISITSMLYAITGNVEMKSSEMGVDIPQYSDIELYDQNNPSGVYLSHQSQNYEWVYAHTFEYASHRMMVDFDREYRMLEFTYYAKSNNAKLQIIDGDTGIVIGFFKASTTSVAKTVQVNVEGVESLIVEFEGRMVMALPSLSAEQGTIQNSNITIEEIKTQTGNLLRYINSIDDKHIATIDASLLFKNELLGYEYGITGGDNLVTRSHFSLPANRFKFLTFEVFCHDRHPWQEQAQVKVLNGTQVLAEITVSDNQYPKRLTVNIEGVENLTIQFERDTFASIVQPQVSAHDFSNLPNSIFSQSEYNITGVVRDYNQKREIELYNSSDERVVVLPMVAGEPNEIPIDFINLESSDVLENFVTLEAGERRNITLAIHTQKAEVEDYTFFLQALDATDHSPRGGATVNLHVNHGNVDFEIEEISHHPGSLTKSMRLTNRGDTVSDFKVSLDDDLDGFVSVQGSFTDLRLQHGETMEFSVIPVLNIRLRMGNIKIQGGGLQKELPLVFAVPGDFTIIGVPVEEVFPEILSQQEGPEFELISRSHLQSSSSKDLYKIEIKDKKTDMAFSYESTTKKLYEIPADVNLSEVTFSVSFPSPEMIQVISTYYIKNKKSLQASSLNSREGGLEWIAQEGRTVVNAMHPVTGFLPTVEAVGGDFNQLFTASNALENGQISPAQYIAYNTWKAAKVAISVVGLVVPPTLGYPLSKVGEFLNLVDGKLQDDMGFGDGSATKKINAFFGALSNTCMNQGTLPMDFSLPPIDGDLGESAMASFRFEQIGATSVKEDIDVSINDWVVANEDGFEAGDNLLHTEIPTEHMNIPGANRMTFRNVSHDNTGYYVALAERQIYIPIDNLIINTVAGSWKHAKFIAPEVFHEQGFQVSVADFAIFKSSINVEPSTPKVGEEATIKLMIDNMGSSPGLVNVKVSDYRNLMYRANVLVKSFDHKEITLPWIPSMPGLNTLRVTLNEGLNGEIVSYREYKIKNNQAIKSVMVEMGANTIDSDSDNIDDNWELTYFGNLTTTTKTSDYDKDGYSDLQEYLNQLLGENDPNGSSYNPKVFNTPGGIGYIEKSNMFYLPSTITYLLN